MNAIYLDCISGISGNMFLGACLQVGVPANYLIRELKKLSLPDEYEIAISDVSKNGIAAIHVDVKVDDDHHEHEHHHHHGHDHEHEHHHEDHHHRNMADIRKIIEQSTLSM